MKTEFFVGYWSRNHVEADASHYYLFGDNEEGWGMGGQAIIRGLPNAFGVPTKRSPHMDDDSFWSDDEYEANVAKIDAALALVPTDKPIFVSEHGIGTGLAQLDVRAPRTFAYLCDRLFKPLDKAPQVV